MTSTRLPTRRKLRLFASELLIGVGIAVSLAAGLSVIVGPNGLEWTTYQPDWPVVGESAYIMAIEATFGADAGVVVANVPRWENTSDGAKDVVTGGPPVEVSGPFTGQIAFLGPTFAQRWAWVFWQAAGQLLIAASLLVVLRVVRSVRAGSPFTSANARRLRILALLVAVGGTALSATGELVRRWLLDTSAAAGIVGGGWSISFVPLLTGVLIGVVAEVWRAGVGMADDLDGVV